ncbi:unnamed protein product, partial [Protopolystoma xenopodis]
PSETHSIGSLSSCETCFSSNSLGQTATNNSTSNRKHGGVLASLFGRYRTSKSSASKKPPTSPSPPVVDDSALEVAPCPTCEPASLIPPSESDLNAPVEKKNPPKALYADAQVSETIEIQTSGVSDAVVDLSSEKDNFESDEVLEYPASGE